MRFIYGLIATAIWTLLGVIILPSASSEMILITCAIVFAGGVAGGA